MNRADFLKSVAETGYNVGFGAKKHFATYGIVCKGPGFIGFISFAIGVLGLVIQCLGAPLISAILAISGVAGLYISFYDTNKDGYAKSGEQLTGLFYEVKHLYQDAKSVQCVEVNPRELELLENIERRYREASNYDQLMFSNWYAHYKFFWEQQIGWIDEQLSFSFWRDKVPLSAYATVVGLLSVIIFITIFCWLTGT